MNKVRRFFNKYAITNLMYYIIAGNVIAFLLDTILWNQFKFDLYSWLTLSPLELFKGQLWRLFTFVFVLPDLGADFVSLVFWNILVLYFYHMIGTNLELYFGTAKFNMIYFCGMACVWVYCILGYFINLFTPSYWVLTQMDSGLINLSLFLSFATVFPDVEFRICFILPVKAKWLGILDFIVLVGSILQAIFFGQILTGMTALAILTNYFIWFGKEWAEKGWFWGKTGARKAKHKSKIIKIKAKDAVRSYRHKCCVCGKTDETDPNMQFRYCVKCSGLKEYCMDHINNHTHE